MSTKSLTIITKSSNVLIFKTSVVHYYTATIIWSSTNSGLAFESTFFFWMNEVLQEVERLRVTSALFPKILLTYSLTLYSQSWFIFYEHLLLSGNAVTRKSIHKKLNSNKQYIIYIYIILQISYKSSIGQILASFLSALSLIQNPPQTLLLLFRLLAPELIFFSYTWDI